MYVFFSSFIVTMYEYQQSTSVHNFSRNVGATFEILGTRRVKWNNFHLEDPQILGATVHNLDGRANWLSGFVHRWDKVYLNVLLTFTLPVFVIICIFGLRTYEYTLFETSRSENLSSIPDRDEDW